MPHHVTQRGNHRQQTFYNDQDRKVYLGLLKDHAERYELRVLGYCLMTNHIHLVVVPETEDSLARALGRTHCRYANYLHARERWQGHLWQNRFYSSVLDEAHLCRAMRYVERNPVRAGVATSAAEYRWSSALAHLTGHDEWGILDLEEWGSRFNPEEWGSLLLEPDDPEVARRIRNSTITGRPLGGEEFVARLGSELGRDFSPKPMGRPKKTNGQGMAAGAAAGGNLSL